MNFIVLINNPDWAKWTESVSSMPLIHWYCYSFLERIFNCFADFSTNFGNGNIMSESCLIKDLNAKGLISAIITFKAFCTQIQLHQAQMTPIIIMPSSVTTISAWNDKQSCPPKRGASGTNNANVKSITSPPEQRCGDKHDPTTPKTSEGSNSSGRQKAKKAEKGSKVDGPAKDRKEMGMSYLKNPNINPPDVFPKDLPIKLCANFTCKGKECTNANCGFKQPSY